MPPPQKNLSRWGTDAYAWGDVAANRVAHFASLSSCYPGWLCFGSNECFYGGLRVFPFHSAHSFHPNAFKHKKTAESGTCTTSSVSYLSSSSPSTSLQLTLNLCVLQALDTFSHSSPSVGRQRAFQPGGHNAEIPANQWQINQCYLFFPCLCCNRFFFSPSPLLLCCLPWLKLCSIKPSPLSETNCDSARFAELRVGR